MNPIATREEAEARERELLSPLACFADSGTRLTHTLEVAQMARFLCLALRLNDGLG